MQILRSIAVKLLYVVLIGYILQPPLNELWKIAVFALCLLMVVSGRALPFTVKRAVCAICIVVTAAFAHLIPEFNIPEGHNALLFDHDKYSVLAEALPHAEYERLKGEFEALYPENKSCKVIKPVGCWRTYEGISAPYAFSADSIYEPGLMSRVVNDISFDSVRSFRGGFLNALQAKLKSGSGVGGSNINSHWFPKEYVDMPGDPEKIDMPYFVRYDVNNNMVGQTLCWKGDVVFYKDGVRRHVLSADEHGMSCYEFQQSDVGLQIWGFKLGEKAVLELKLVKHMTWSYVRMLAKNVLLGAMAILLALGAVKLSPKRFFEMGASAAFVYAVGSLYTGDYFHNFFYQQFYRGGDDPLTHWGYGRLILQDLMAGNLKVALMGVEPVYFFMPGYRYFHAVEMLVFGEASIASMMIFLLYPLIFFKVCRLFMGQRTSLVLLLVFCAFLPRYLSWTLGFGELVCHPIALMGVYCLSRAYFDKENVQVFGLFAGLCFCASIFLRPDFSVPIFLIFVSAIFYFPVRFYYGFVPPLALVLLMPVHNLYYGSQFVLFTSSSGNPENLQVLLTDYYKSVLTMLSVSSHVESVNKLRAHAIEWVKAPSGVFWVLFFLVAPVLCIFKRALKIRCEVSALRKIFMPPMLFIVLFEAGLQLTHLFFKTTHRYSLFTGVLSLIIIAFVVTQLFVRDGYAGKSSAN